MIDAIKYLCPWELRRTESFIIPKGPSFSKAPIKYCQIGGCDVSFKLPKWKNDKLHNQLGPKFGDWESLPMNDQLYPGWTSSIMMYVVWKFIGPWFTGQAAIVNASITLQKPRKANNTASFFHPVAFEQAVTQLKAFQLCPEKYTTSKYEYTAPVNWRPLDLPVPAVYFETIPVDNSGYRHEECWLAVNDDLLVNFSFRIDQAYPGDNTEVDKKIDRQPMKDLVLQVVNSLNVSLSPELQTKIDSIKENNPNIAISETCAPLDLKSYESELAKAIKDDEKAKQDELDRRAKQPDNIAAEIIRRVKENPELLKSKNQ